VAVWCGLTCNGESQVRSKPRKASWESGGCMRDEAWIASTGGKREGKTLMFSQGDAGPRHVLAQCVAKPNGGQPH
jgi:hypothetical protein